MLRSSLLQVVNFQSGRNSDVNKKGGRRKMFLKSTYSFFLSFFYGQVVEQAEKSIFWRYFSLDHCIHVLPWVSFDLTVPIHKNPEFLSLPTGSKLVTPQSFSFLARPLPIGYLNFYYFSFFLISNRMGAWRRCVATRLYILYVAANESTSGWEFYC